MAIARLLEIIPLGTAAGWQWKILKCILRLIRIGKVVHLKLKEVRLHKSMGNPGKDVITDKDDAMELTELVAIKAYARMMNTRDIKHFEPLIADDIELKSQVQSKPVQGKDAFLDFMVKNFEKIADDAPVWAEIGEIHKSGRTRPCAVLSQYSMENMVASATVEIEGNKIKRLKLFFIPSPEEAERTGEFPT